ncbi:IclR family transcriptional regulator [Effusibacillus dendaii]|uniref:Glycerol operon regulatory protein n=1 Tax=Effusibacillus dendaii TaxID=2743772 RepID=A0A7I8DDX0_9BACL|nr:IclR family transcriptional regulator [Effusibacillus dendaii]BCJ88403.1 IclR family transcriptional regulator [Effusibacillus dendaii]
MAKGQETLSSVHNAMRILQEFSKEGPELGISELSHRLGLAKSTVFRLIRTLSESHLVQQNKKSQKYHLGLGVFVLGSSVYHKMEIRQVALPFLEKLLKSTNKVVRLGVYDQGGVVYLSKLPEDQETRSFSSIGRRVPAYCTAIGKLLLAYQPLTEIERVLQEELKAVTPNTITSRDKLHEQLDMIRKNGYAVTYEETRPGICSVAVPVFDDMHEVVAAISVTGSKSHFYQVQTQGYVKEMRMYSRLISEQLSPE